MTAEIEALARSLLDEAIIAGRLPADPSPETTAHVAGVLAGAHGVGKQRAATGWLPATALTGEYVHAHRSPSA
jgi:hypothetical protein